MRLRCYRLFTGYELDTKGSDVSSGMDMSLCWTNHSILQRIQGCKIAECEINKLWFVAPQMGDRMLMIKDHSLKMMGGQTDQNTLRICSYLMSDNVMAYIQCALFGTITNMLPCHANGDLTESVMTAIDSSMTKFSAMVRYQSANLMTALSESDSCLYTAGVGFAGQDKGNNLYFGNVFTGPNEKRPVLNHSRLGVFTSVTLGIANNTMMKNMLDVTLGKCSDGGLHSMLSKPCKPQRVCKVTMDGLFYARYHHRFNTGEFTEVACVEAMSDPGYNNLVHEEKLTNNSKYQLTMAHGPLPMCVLTLAMTMRQNVMMVMGFLCAELARLVYTPKVTDATLCKHIVSLSMAAKFRHGKDDESSNVFSASYGNLLKLTGPVFSNLSKTGVTCDLESMEWLQMNNRLPDYIRRSLDMIGDTKQVVRGIMQHKNVSYNRVLFLNEMGVMLSFTSVFAHEEYSYGSVKLCRRGCFYKVQVFSNRCVDKNLYTSHVKGVTGVSEKKITIDQMVEMIKREVSCVVPIIDVNRIKMMTPELNETEFDLEQQHPCVWPGGIRFSFMFYNANGDWSIFTCPCGWCDTTRGGIQRQR